MFCFQSPFTRTSRGPVESVTTSTTTTTTTTTTASTATSSSCSSSSPSPSTSSSSSGAAATTTAAASPTVVPLENQQRTKSSPTGPSAGLITVSSGPSVAVVPLVGSLETHQNTDKRRGSEAVSEGSGSSSIRFIDQEVSISGGSSTDTLPGIRADYFDADPLSPVPVVSSVNGPKNLESTSSSNSSSVVYAKTTTNNSMVINNLDSNRALNGPSSIGLNSMTNIRVVENNVDGSSSHFQQGTTTTGSLGAKCPGNNGGGVGNGGGGNGGGGRWRRKLLLRLRSSDSTNSSNNGEPCCSLSTSPSPSPVSSSDNTSSTRSNSSKNNSNNRKNNYNNQDKKNHRNREEDKIIIGESTTSSGLTYHRRRGELVATSTVVPKQPDLEENNEPMMVGGNNCARENANLRSPIIFASSTNDIPSLENGFSDPEDEEENRRVNEVDADEDEEEEEDLDRCNNDDETETEDGSSLPSSPAAALSGTLANVQPPPITTYYGFLSVNGGAMRQETTSTSSPQLSSGTTVNSGTASPLANETASLIGECPATAGITGLKPDSLDATSCLPAARSCPNLEQQSAGCSSTSGSSSPSPSPGPAGPRFKPLEEGDIQVCYLNHTRTLVSKILSSKFLRRWETHHLYLNDACLSSKTLTGFLQQPVPYSSMSEVYAVARWDPTYKYCLRIVLPDGSLLLQASNAYTRDQWYHSILWKKSIFKYQHLVSVNTREEIILRELKTMVDFALWTPLQDERVNGAPLEAVAKLLEDPIVVENNLKDDKKAIEIEESNRGRGDRRSWAEAVLSAAAPLLEKAAPPPALARALARLAQRHPRSPLVIALSPAITRCLKHTVDFGKSPDMRKLLQVFVAALYENNDGEQTIRDYIASVHGPGSDCPHPRVLPNLVSICVAAIFHRFDVANRKATNNDDDDSPPPLRCYLLVLKVASEYADWRPGLGSLLQPVPFPERALADKEVQEAVMLNVMRRLAQDPRCSVHQVLLPVREPRPGWIHIAAPSSNDACPDEGALFGEMLTTLLGCCCRRKRFIASLVKQTWRACMLLGVRGCDAAQEALCLMLEWRLLPNEEHRLQVVSALQSTQSGKNRYATLCQRQRNLQELQQKGGPKKLTLPARATDADVAVILGGGALGNLEYLTLAFTSVTSACAEQLIKLPALRYLNLWATQFGDAGLQMISEHLQKLQVLNLCETPVSDKGISTLASLTSLRKLNLNSTKLSAQTFESLKKRLPSLQEFDVRYTEAW